MNSDDHDERCVVLKSVFVTMWREKTNLGAIVPGISTELYCAPFVLLGEKSRL